MQRVWHSDFYELRKKKYQYILDGNNVIISILLSWKQIKMMTKISGFKFLRKYTLVLLCLSPGMIIICDVSVQAPLLTEWNVVGINFSLMNLSFIHTYVRFTRIELAQNFFLVLDEYYNK